MKFTIRDMTSEDWEAVAAIYRQGLDTGIATFQTEVPTYESWNAAHSPDCRFVIVDETDRVAGWAVLSPTSARPVYAGVREVSIYIHRDYRRQNLGERLMFYMIDRSEKAGVWMLYSSIFEENKASLHLHDKCGFRTVGYRERIARDAQGNWHTTIVMERRSTLPEFGGDGK